VIRLSSLLLSKQNSPWENFFRVSFVFTGIEVFLVKDTSNGTLPDPQEVSEWIETGEPVFNPFARMISVILN